MLEQFLAKRDIIENILQDLIEYPLKSGLEMLDSDWEVVQDLITVLEPFKVFKHTTLNLSKNLTPSCGSH